MKHSINLLILFFATQISFAQDGENPLPYKFEEAPFDIAPQFPGGTPSMNKFFTDSIRYPEPEKSKGLEGSVQLKFLITKKGKVTKVEAINGTPGAPNFVKEAISIIEKMPLWIPATKKGKSVAAAYYLSVPFKLK
ncbi:MAG: energy transducer TonB [Bacteroidia bacterium]